MEKAVRFNNQDEQRILFGPRDRFLRLIREHHQVRVSLRNSKLKIEGNAEDVMKAQFSIYKLLDIVRHQRSLTIEDVETVLFSMDLENNVTGIPVGNEPTGSRTKSLVHPQTQGQQEYIEAIKSYDVVFSIGPAGTGKTYLATAQAVESLHQKRVRKIVLVRPAVEAGEKLGFLPGDMNEKINPYLRPVFDALENLLDFGILKRYIERDIIEVAPLAFMRGRTLDYSFIILDEAQNTTPKQMKMFLTRFGKHSKVVVTGDITQVDLEKGETSGLVDAINVLRNIKDIKLISLTEKDIVRHHLVQEIVNAYEARRLFSKNNLAGIGQDDGIAENSSDLTDSTIDITNPEGAMTESHNISAMNKPQQLIPEEPEDSDSSEQNDDFGSIERKAE